MWMWFYPTNLLFMLWLYIVQTTSVFVICFFVPFVIIVGVLVQHFNRHVDSHGTYSYSRLHHVGIQLPITHSSNMDSMATKFCWGDSTSKDNFYTHVKTICSWIWTKGHNPFTCLLVTTLKRYDVPFTSLVLGDKGWATIPSFCT